MLKDVFNDMAHVVSEHLGQACQYTTGEGEVIENVLITINEGKPVPNEFGVIAGYAVEAGILKSQVAFPQYGDVFRDASGRQWRVQAATRHTTGVTYVQLI